MLLSIRSLSKSFPGTKALDAVDFDLRAGEVHALLGENGAGKSTLIKCLTGAYRRDAGEILLDGRSVSPASPSEAQELGIGTVYQEVNLLPNLTVAQNLTFGREPLRFGMIDERGRRAMAREMLSGYALDIDVSRDLGSYSVAIQQIVAIARAVAISGKVLILDEPTASLDAAEVRMLFDVVRDLRDRGLGMVFVSHFLDQVFEISDRLTVLRNGRKIATEATADLDRLALIEHMLGRELEETTAREAAKTDPDAKSRPEVLRFERTGSPGVVEPFDLTVHEGEVIGLAGLLGSGRTESAELMFGVRAPQSGTARDVEGPVRHSNPRDAIASGFGFAPEDRKTDGIVADLSVRENIILAMQAHRGWTRPIPRSEQNRLADEYIAKLDIRTSDAEKAIGDLSGGNQQKVVLARWLAMNPRFLILDEPTRGIDVGAHAEILRLIHEMTDRGMAVLVISSEFDELIAVADRVIVLRDRRHARELVGADVTADAIVRAIAAHDAPRDDDARGCLMKRAFLRVLPQILTLAALMALVTIFFPQFLSIDYQGGRLSGPVIDVLKRGAPVALLAVGMTLVIATRGIDLSVGTILAITGAVSAWCVADGWGVLPAVALALATGLVCGIWNGCLVAIVGIQPIVATLILMTSGRGIAQLITEGRILTFTDPAFAQLGSGIFFGLPVPVFIWVLTAVAVAVLMRRTALGLLVEAIGINRSASALAGVNATVLLIAVYMASGLCAALAGIIVTADIRGADANNAGLWLELDAILAVVIGGTSLLGGRFSIAASVLGAMIIQTIDTGILLAGFPSQYNLVIKAGLVLLILLIQSPNLAGHWHFIRQSLQRGPNAVPGRAKS